MANFLINLFKSAPKSDSFRPTDTPDKYTGQVAALNASGANNSGTKAVKITSAIPTPTSNGNTKIPG